MTKKKSALDFKFQVRDLSCLSLGDKAFHFAVEFLG